MRTLIVAHRGARGLVAHENTVEAFEKAIEVGADMVEFDVRRTRDGELAVFHDASLADGRLVADLTFEELREHGRAHGFEVPDLKTAIAVNAGRVRLDVELKEAGYEAEVVRQLTAALPYDQFVVKSFVDRCVRTVKLLDKRVQAGLLLGVDCRERVVQTRLGELFPARRLAHCRADFVSPNVGLLRLGFPTRMALRKMPVFVWTVNDEPTMARLLDIGVDAIITDRPDLALALRERRC